MHRDHEIAEPSNLLTEEEGSARLNGDPVHAESTQPIIILNADDWGLNDRTTDCMLQCVRAGVLSCVSAMVFMDVSEKAAECAHEDEIDAGLHLNLTTAFTGSRPSLALREHHGKVISYLRGWKFHRVLFNPLLMNSFEYVVKAQIDEFTRLYGAPLMHLDGHHHMHLCANVLLGGLLPEGTIVRRGKSSLPGEKRFVTRFCRHFQNSFLERWHRTTDYLFDLVPLKRDRLQKIANLALSFDVEVAAHPADEDEFQFLLDGGLSRYLEGVTIARGYHLRDEVTQARAQMPQTHSRDRATGAHHP